MSYDVLFSHNTSDMRNYTYTLTLINSKNNIYGFAVLQICFVGAGAGFWFSLALLPCCRRPEADTAPPVLRPCCPPWCIVSLAAHPAQLAALIPALMLGDFIYYIVAAAANKLPYKFCPKISVNFCLVW